MKVQECPQCGAPLAKSERLCRYCKSELVELDPPPLPMSQSDSGRVQRPTRSQSSTQTQERASRGAQDINVRLNKYRSIGSFPLACAALNRDAEAVQILLDEGADVDERDAGDGKTALHMVAAGGFDDIVSLLLENGADVNAEDDKRETPLSYAVSMRRVPVVEALLENGADPEHTDSTGESPLTRAEVLAELMTEDNISSKILEALRSSA